LAARIRTIQAGVVIIVGAATLVISVLPPLMFAQRSMPAQSGAETAGVFVSVLAAYLLYGRFRNRGRVSDLVLFVALVLLVVANLTRVLSPALTEADSDNFAVWIPLTTSLFAVGALAAAAFAPPAPLRDRATAIRLAVGAVVALGVAVLAVALLSPHLSTGIDPNLSPADSSRPRVVGAPGLLAAHLAVMGLAGTAAVGFTRWAERTGDELMAWLAIASTLGAFSRLNYFLFPSGYLEWVFTGDVLRLGAYAAILIGALRQISVYQQRAAEAAVFEERRRIARDLHDGLAQDLAFITMHARGLEQRDPRAEVIVAAAEQALTESRGTILTLTVPADEPLHQGIARVASGLATRSQVGLELDLDERADLAPGARAELLLVLREAIRNATSHGNASTIHVTLSTEEGLRLMISDDGCGFNGDVAADGAGAGFGLTCMRERVERLGGELRIRSRPGAATEVEVVLP
jgi:signal transduction histidine kinase